jgi:hypothetical protein
MYASYLHHFFLFNIQQTSEYKWLVLYDKRCLNSLVDVFMQLVVKTILSQTKYCILSPFGGRFAVYWCICITFKTGTFLELNIYFCFSKKIDYSNEF